jgi:hypothetical protein
VILKQAKNGTDMLEKAISSFKLGILVSVVAVTTGCVTHYYVAPDDFVNQVVTTQSKSASPTGLYVVSPLASLFFNSRYDANNVRKVLCRDKSGNLVYLFPDRNTQLEITSKSTKEVTKMYFDTVFLEGNKLVGLRSRLLGTPREIALADIEEIRIYAEFPHTEKAQ